MALQKAMCGHPYIPPITCLLYTDSWCHYCSMHGTFIRRRENILLYGTVMSWLWQSILQFCFVTDSFLSFSEVCRVPCLICSNEFMSSCLSICYLHKQEWGQSKSSGYVQVLTIQKSKKSDDTTQVYLFHVQK